MLHNGGFWTGGLCGLMLGLTIGIWIFVAGVTRALDLTMTPGMDVWAADANLVTPMFRIASCWLTRPDGKTLTVHWPARSDGQCYAADKPRALTP